MKVLKSFVLIIFLVTVVFGIRGFASAGSLYFDDFGSYTNTDMNPPSQGDYATNWNSDSSYTATNGAWHISADPIHAPGNGQFANTFGLPSGANSRWLSFTVNEASVITGATLQFDYLVQTNANLSVWISSVDSYTGLVAVPFTFVKRANNGEIVDNTGIIDLTPYLANSSRLVVKFDALTNGTSFSHISIDNFSLSTTMSTGGSTPTPVGYDMHWLIITLVGLTLVGGYLLRKRFI